MTDDELRLLQQFGRKRPFTVPDGYFDQLNKTILDAVERESRKAPTVSLWQRIRKPVAIAACLCALVGIALGFLSRDPSETIVAQQTKQSPAEQRDSQASATKQLAEAPKMQTAAVLALPFTDEEEAPAVAAKQAEGAPQTGATPSQTASKKSQKATRTTKAIANHSAKEKTLGEAGDALDIAADLMMLDSDDLYAMLDEE